MDIASNIMPIGTIDNQIAALWKEVCELRQAIRWLLFFVEGGMYPHELLREKEKLAEIERLVEAQPGRQDEGGDDSQIKGN